ncbi:alpha/beta fold hydrolase [Calidifontibacter terrae]
MPLTTTGIAYDLLPADTADAPAVVLVHAGVADRRMWDDQVAALRGEPTLLRLDLRGYGDSVTPAEGAWSHADDILAVLDEAGIARAHLVGSSFGAGVAVEVALTAPDRVASLLLAPPGGSLLVTLTDDLEAFFAAERAALEAGDLDGAVEANVATWVVGSGRTESVVSAGVADRVRTMQRRAFEAAELIGDREPGELDPGPQERAGEIAVPVLLLTGDHDLDTTDDAAQRLAQALPDVRRERWADAAHLPSLEHPDRFTRLLREWVHASR